MSDNVNVTPGSGDVVAADDIAGVKFQRVKVTVGADGVNGGDVSTTNPLPTLPNVSVGADYVPNIPYTHVSFGNLKTDPDNQLITRGDVLTDEGQFRDDFIGATLDLTRWTETLVSGGSDSVSSSLLNLVSGTTSGGAAGVTAVGDYGPISLRMQATISQRIANQTIELGFKDNITTPAIGAYFQFTGTNNAVVTCVSRSSINAADIQTTAVNIPNGTSANSKEYYIEIQPDQVSFIIDGFVVANHRLHIPGPYDAVNAIAYIVNAAAVTSTTVSIDYMYLINQNSLQVNNSFLGDDLFVKVRAGTVSTYAAATTAAVTPAATPTDVFTITGAANKKIKIKHISIDGNQTTAGTINIRLVKRSTANTAGTSTTLTAVPFDSNNAAAAATVRAYTANPTTGTLVGAIHSEKLFVSTTTGQQEELVLDYTNINNMQEIVLNNANEVLAINLGGVTVTGGSFNFDITWTEE